MSFRICASLCAVLLFVVTTKSQTQNAPRSEVAGIPVNYDEAKVGTYTLPDPLTLANGKPVRDAKTWNQKRRAEILRLFEENQFGRSPGRPAGMSFDVFDKGTPALDGKAIRRQVTIYFSPNKTGPKMERNHSIGLGFVFEIHADALAITHSGGTMSCLWWKADAPQQSSEPRV